MENTPEKGTAPDSTIPERFESDAQKIVRKHLEDKNHVITEDEIRSVRVGMAPPPDEINNPERQTEEEHRRDEDVDPADAPLTPWDTLEP